MSNSTTTSTPAKAATQDTVAGQSMNEDEEKPILRGQVVDTTGSRNRAWLVKVPMQLAEQWHSGAADAILGRVEIAPPQRGTQQTRPRITVVDQSGHVYSCESLERPPMYVISRKRKVRSDDDGGGGGDDEEDDEEEDSDADLDEEIPMDASAAAAPRSYGAAIYASVEQSLSLTPQLTQAYSREFGKRLRREEERRKMLVVSDDIVPRGVRAAPIVSQRAGTTTTAAAAAAAAMAPPPRVVAAPVRMRKEPEQRAERMDKDKLHTLLLSLFSRKERWRLVELRGVVNQPMEWLKENLAEITVFNTRGMHKGTYELKEEYRIKEGTTDAQAAAAADDEERAQEKEASADEEWV